MNSKDRLIFKCLLKKHAFFSIEKLIESNELIFVRHREKCLVNVKNR
jgi:hypothetical protein